MQDIAGCRIVFWPVEEVYEFMRRFKDLAASPEVRIYDYISKPKADGYRSIHVVIRYNSRSPKYSHLNGEKIEIELRSSLQHAWATAVETVDLFSGQALKVGKEKTSGADSSLSRRPSSLPLNTPIGSKVRLKIRGA